ncbi:2-oxoglutarate and iron-dependent oxygenase domain-containing protein 3-like [Danaus plexippus]|uniref:2-oxoglutarate and iron-dependent oxygenase domain-containing protein 3-like n=1 Tax=Danaus plexippus TaxID=13037 RepID=UPI002AB1586E|nr:2-oxoglutarate and iron-dependent oxygenase domain-containing protein 3-like [Danaus plexippus]
MSEVKRRNKQSISTDKILESEEKKAKEKASPNKNLPLRILSRTVVIFSLLIIVYMSAKDKTKIFAKQTEVIPGKGLIIECSSEYMKELDEYEGCAPKNCKRYVTDTVISTKEADELLNMAKRGLKHGGSLGGASILDLHSGALSKGSNFVNFYKLKEMKNIFDQNDFNTFRVVKDKIRYAIAHHFGVQPTKIYLTYPTFFSEISTKKAVTIHDEYWHPHVDKESYKSFHYTTLLYLGDYNIDFKGGQFVFIDSNYNYTVEPRKGRLSMFTSGAENLHHVQKVTSGVRYAMTISFTCNKNYAIADPGVEKYIS